MPVYVWVELPEQQEQPDHIHDGRIPRKRRKPRKIKNVKLARPCERCGARPGESCIMPDGREHPPHRERREDKPVTVKEE